MGKLRRFHCAMRSPATGNPNSLVPSTLRTMSTIACYSLSYPVPFERTSNQPRATACFDGSRQFQLEIHRPKVRHTVEDYHNPKDALRAHALFSLLVHDGFVANAVLASFANRLAEISAAINAGGTTSTIISSNSSGCREGCPGLLPRSQQGIASIRFIFISFSRTPVGNGFLSERSNGMPVRWKPSQQSDRF